MAPKNKQDWLGVPVRRSLEVCRCAPHQTVTRRVVSLSLMDDPTAWAVRLLKALPPRACVWALAMLDGAEAYPCYPPVLRH